MPDHVHMLLNVPPKLSVSSVVGCLGMVSETQATNLTVGKMGTVVIIGDGRTQADAACPGSFGWGDAMISFFRQGVKVTNLPAQKTAEMLSMKPDLVIVALGQGDADAKTPLPNFEMRLKNLVTALRNQRAEPFLVTPPLLGMVDPSTGKPVTANHAADAQPYANAIKKVAAESYVMFVDLRASMEAASKELGKRDNWYLYPPVDPSQEWPLIKLASEKYRAPKPRNPQFFSETGAETLAHWVVNLIRTGASPLKSLLRPVDGPPSADFKLVWKDEFDGTELNKSNWKCSPLAKRQEGMNDPNCAHLDGRGHLVIEIKKEGDDYHAEMVTSAGERIWTGGYFECRATLPKDQGFWSAFWLMGNKVSAPQKGTRALNDTLHNGTEIDIFEWMQPFGNRLQNTLHWNGYGAEHATSAFSALVPDLMKEEWHVFGVDWRPDGYTFYVDGRRTSETKIAPSQAPENIILSVEIGKWGGDISKANLPQQVQFDWVRVWQK